MSEKTPVETQVSRSPCKKITKAISKMASGKAAEPSGIVTEMLMPVVTVKKLDLIEDIVSDGYILTVWQ